MSAKSSLIALRSYAPAIIIILAGFFMAYQFVEPAPPRYLTISTGSEDGAYSGFAKRYAAIMAKEGIELRIRTSAGSIENLRRLSNADGKEATTDVAFVQGGTVDASTDTGLRSLGSVYFEPLWIFYRGEVPWQRLSDLAGKRVATGEAGSGTRRLASELLQVNALRAAQIIRLDLGGKAAANALINGEIDALMLVAGPDAEIVEQLMRTPGVSLMDMRRAGAYSRLYPYLSKRKLYEGMIDMNANIPAQDVRLLAPTANLVAREGVHPALLDLLLQAAQEVHAPGGWFEDRNRFPSGEMLVLPLHTDAKRFYKYGPSFLQRFLPFWAATLIDRLKVMLLPLLVILLPLSKIMPPLYNWRMRSRIYQWYRELEAAESRIRATIDAESLDHLVAELDRIESEVSKVDVPLSFVGQAYDLRLHVEMVRRQAKIKSAG